MKLKKKKNRLSLKIELLLANDLGPLFLFASNLAKLPHFQFPFSKHQVGILRTITLLEGNSRIRLHSLGFKHSDSVIRMWGKKKFFSGEKESTKEGECHRRQLAGTMADTGISGFILSVTEVDGRQGESG